MSVPFMIGLSIALVVIAAGLVMFAIPRDDGWAVATYAVAVIAVIAAVIFVFVAFATWDEHKKTERGRGDAPRVTEQLIDGRTADGVSEFPDGWGNVATKCVWNGYRAFETTKASGASSLVIVIDSACKFVATGPR